MKKILIVASLGAILCAPLLMAETDYPSETRLDRLERRIRHALSPYDSATNFQQGIRTPSNVTINGSADLNTLTATNRVWFQSGVRFSYGSLGGLTNNQIIPAATLGIYDTVDITSSGTNGQAFVLAAPGATNIGHSITIHNDDTTNSMLMRTTNLKSPDITLATNASVTLKGYSGSLWLPVSSWP